jgi:hypothetical protein
MGAGPAGEQRRGGGGGEGRLTARDNRMSSRATGYCEYRYMDV